MVSCSPRRPQLTSILPLAAVLIISRQRTPLPVGTHLRSLCVLCLQCIPGGGGGGATTQGTGHSGDPALLPGSHPLPECHAAELTVLLHRSVPCRGHPLTTAVHRGRQQNLQRLLERPPAASEKLQHLLPGCQHCQRGACCSWCFSSYVPHTYMRLYV